MDNPTYNIVNPLSSKPPFEARLLFLILITVFFFSHTLFAQFRITGMEGEGGTNWVILKTLHENGFEKQTNVTVQYNPNRAYKSGTFFETSPNSKIQLQYRGQTILLKENSSIETKVYNNGATVKTFSGKVMAYLENVKSKLGFFKIGNGYVWAHAEGTVFEVSTSPNSKVASFATQDNSVINVLEEVDVKVPGYTGKKTPTLTVSKKIESNQYYSGGNLPQKEYDNLNDGIADFRDRISHKLSSDSYDIIEELADDYLTLGMLYESAENYGEAAIYYRDAREIYYEWEPDSDNCKYSSLSLASALIKTNQVTEGKNMVTYILPELLDDINYYYDDCQYWEALDNLAIAYELLGDDPKSEYYDNLADEIPCND